MFNLEVTSHYPILKPLEGGVKISAYALDEISNTIYFLTTSSTLIIHQYDINNPFTTIVLF